MSEKPEEVFALAKPWSDPNTGGKLEVLSLRWVPHQECWFLLGGIRYAENQTDEEATFCAKCGEKTI